jgi:hypothetical protein
MRHIASLVFAAGVLGSAASASTLTFQQGADGYTGCADTTLVGSGHEYSDAINHGEETDLIVNVSHDTPG